jgi:hypothetical protein
VSFSSCFEEGTRVSFSSRFVKSGYCFQVSDSEKVTTSSKKKTVTTFSRDQKSRLWAHSPQIRFIIPLRAEKKFENISPTCLFVEVCTDILHAQAREKDTIVVGYFFPSPLPPKIGRLNPWGWEGGEGAKTPLLYVL